MAAAARPVEGLGQAVQVTASIGVTRYPQQESVTADGLLRQADRAMYEAKSLGRNRMAWAADAGVKPSVQGLGSRPTAKGRSTSA